MSVVEEMEPTIQLTDGDLITMMEAGYLSLRMGRFDQAKIIFEGVSVLEPKSDVPWVALGSVCFAQHKFDQALKNYRKALTLKPSSAFARAYLGESLFFSGKKDEAIEELKKAISLDPTGASGQFAKTLLTSIVDGFSPPGVSKKV